MSQRKPGRRSENSSNFNNSSIEIAPRLAYCEGIAISTKHFTFLKLPVFSTKVTERFKINPDPIGKDGGATRHQFSPTGETVSYTAQASELWITDGRSLTSAAEVLEDAFQWWRKFIDEMSIP